MESRRFDALARALSRPGTRRRALAAFLSSALGLGSAATVTPDDVSAKRGHKKDKQKKRRERSVKVEGPCGNGSGKASRCKKNKHCCTGFCDRQERRRKKGKRGNKRQVLGRCRCRTVGQSCTEDRNCCPEQTGRVCRQGACRCGEVCADGCRYPTIQAAIDDPQGPAAIRLCAETTGSSSPSPGI